jgi:hypothetical protein
MKTHLTIVLLLFASTLLAQPGDPSSDPDVPITGIEVLISGGLALGIRHLLKRKKQ